MDDKEAAWAAVNEFLTTRRARVTPTDAGLPPQGTRRRVKGLRREDIDRTIAPSSTRASRTLHVTSPAVSARLWNSDGRIRSLSPL